MVNNEPSTGQVLYNLGVGAVDSYSASTDEDKNLTQSHVVIISNLQSAATYHLKIISKDASNNQGVSDDYTILTLNQEETLLQYVVRTLQGKFNWLQTYFK